MLENQSLGLNQLLELSILIIFPPQPPGVLPVNATMMPGKDMIEDAKIIGITPAVLTFSGIWED